MSKRLSFYGLIGLISLCIFFLAFTQHYGGYLERRLQPVLSEVEIKSRHFRFRESETAYIRHSPENATLIEIEEVVNQERRSIEREMQDYQYPNGKYDINASKLSDLVLETGGVPLRSVVLTSWRSGSTFLGDILNAHPANFYHYEPLLDFGIIQIRGSHLADDALKNIESMLKCDYSNLDRYLQYGKNLHPWVLNHNTRLWKYCLNHQKICWDQRFVSKMCRLFPFQSMKIVRLRLNVAEELLSKKNLKVKIILLVRDPRGILQSRRHREWCPRSPDCADPSLLCADMESDFNAAVELSNKYPKNFRVMRYEDLSLNPYRHAKELFEFYGLYFHPDVLRFLDTHTKNDIGGVSSTYRNSKLVPFHWRNDLEFSEVDEIQSVCTTAMKLWGYVLAMNATHLKEFHPLTGYFLKQQEPL